MNVDSSYSAEQNMQRQNYNVGPTLFQCWIKTSTQNVPWLLPWQSSWNVEITTSNSQRLLNVDLVTSNLQRCGKVASTSESSFNS